MQFQLAPPWIFHPWPLLSSLIHKPDWVFLFCLNKNLRTVTKMKNCEVSGDDVAGLWRRHCFQSTCFLTDLWIIGRWMPPLQYTMHRITCVKHVSPWNQNQSQATEFIAPSLSVFLVAICTEAKREKKAEHSTGWKDISKIRLLCLNKMFQTTSDLIQILLKVISGHFDALFVVSFKEVFYRKHWSTRGKKQQTGLFAHACFPFCG